MEIELSWIQQGEVHKCATSAVTLCPVPTTQKGPELGAEGSTDTFWKSLITLPLYCKCTLMGQCMICFPGSPFFPIWGPSRAQMESRKGRAQMCTLQGISRQSIVVAIQFGGSSTRSISWVSQWGKLLMHPRSRYPRHAGTEFAITLAAAHQQ